MQIVAGTGAGRSPSVSTACGYSLNIIVNMI